MIEQRTQLETQYHSVSVLVVLHLISIGVGRKSSLFYLYLMMMMRNDVYDIRTVYCVRVLLLCTVIVYIILICDIY